ncbi:MAG TPA: hypothetical protein VMX54_13515 [Vicinamibacteria bacterium]|nr:hypothetical protein [Vicinamibacteria bacterium]
MSVVGGRVAVVVVLASVLLFVAWGLAPEAALFRDAQSQHALLALASVLKLGLLVAGALVAFACRDRLEDGNPARPAWALLAAGLFATLAGQLSLAPYQLFSGQSPFPSVGDLFYVLSYPFFIAAFLVFLRAYREAGFPMGSAAERVGIVAGVGLLAILLAVVILRPVAAAGGADLLERILSVAYPVLDLVLLLPLALLLRVALRLGTSRAGLVWGELLAGFVFLCLSDMLFAYLTALGQQHLDPYTHACYVLAYGLVTGGALQQLRLLKA